MVNAVDTSYSKWSKCKRADYLEFPPVQTRGWKSSTNPALPPSRTPSPVAMYCNMLQCVAVCCSVVRRVVVCGSQILRRLLHEPPDTSGVCNINTSTHQVSAYAHNTCIHQVCVYVYTECECVYQYLYTPRVCVRINTYIYTACECMHEYLYTKCVYIPIPVFT